MDLLKKIFPLSWKYKKDAKDLIIGIIIYLVAGAIAGVLITVATKIAGLLGAIGGLLAAVIGAVGGLIGLYVLIGIVLEVLLFTKVLKD